MRKRLFPFLLAISFLFTSPLLVFAETLYLYDSKVIPENGMTAIAHRGYSAIAPENTLPAFRLAGAYGFWGAECDISQTADGIWILMHDSTVDRMTDGTGRVQDLNYAEISALTVDAGNNIEQYPDLKVPMLTEYLDVCKQYSMHPVIEIKQTVQPEQLPSLAELLGAREETDRMIFISFGRELISEMKALMPEVPAFLIASPATLDDVAFCREKGLEGLDFSSPTQVDVVCAAQEAGLKTAVWTVDSLPLAESFYQMNVEYITTNVLVPGKTPAAVPTTEAPATGSEASTVNDKPAQKLNFFQRIIQWFRNLFAKLFGKKS